MEFHTLAPVTGVDIGGLIVDYAVAVARQRDGADLVIKP